MNFVEYVIISINQLESRGQTSIKKIINLYIIAAQNNKDCVCFLYKQEPENTKSQLSVFILMNGSALSCVQILWLAHRIIALNGDVEEKSWAFHSNK